MSDYSEKKAEAAYEDAAIEEAEKKKGRGRAEWNHRSGGAATYSDAFGNSISRHENQFVDYPRSC